MLQSCAALLPLLVPSHRADPGEAGSAAADVVGLWTQWRGPARDGQTPGRPWPDDLSPERLVPLWRVGGLGPSYSGPVLDAERVYTTETVDEDAEVVRAYARETGREVWSADWPGSMDVPFFAARNGSWIRATPALDDEALYVAGMCDAVVCLEKRTGEVRWHLDTSEERGRPEPQFGQVASPLLHDDGVFVHAGGAFLKLDRRTGETLWSALEEPGASNEGAFSSPVLARIGGRDQLVVQARTALAGLDPDTGEALWSTPVRSFRGMNILTPLVVGDAVFTTAYGGRAHRFEIWPAEEGAGSFEVSSAWNVGLQGYMTSPVLVDGHAYLFLRNNRVACIDVGTGEERWMSPPTGDSYWSLAARGGRLLALADTGILRVLEATPEGFRVLDERELVDGEAWAHVAPDGDELFVRELRGLAAFRFR